MSLCDILTVNQLLDNLAELWPNEKNLLAIPAGLSVQLNSVGQTKLNSTEQRNWNSPEKLNSTEQTKLNSTEQTKLNSTEQTKLNSTERTKLNSPEKLNSTEQRNWNSPEKLNSTEISDQALANFQKGNYLYFRSFNLESRENFKLFNGKIAREIIYPPGYEEWKKTIPENAPTLARLFSFLCFLKSGTTGIVQIEYNNPFDPSGLNVKKVDLDNLYAEVIKLTQKENAKESRNETLDAVATNIEPATILFAKLLNLVKISSRRNLRKPSPNAKTSPKTKTNPKTNLNATSNAKTGPKTKTNPKTKPGPNAGTSNAKANPKTNSNAKANPKTNSNATPKAGPSNTNSNAKPTKRKAADSLDYPFASKITAIPEPISLRDLTLARNHAKDQRLAAQIEAQRLAEELEFQRLSNQIQQQREELLETLN